MAKAKAYILEGSLAKGVVKLSAPIVFSMFFASLFNIVDVFWVGRISAEAVAAVSLSWPVLFVMIALAAGVSVGCSALVARYVGAKQLGLASIAAKNSFYLAIFFSVLVTIGGLLLQRSIFIFLGAEGNLLELTLSYSTVFFFSTILLFFDFVFSAIFRGEGDTKTPMVVGVTMNALNMALDPLFIFTFGLGVAGAAWAGVVARILGTIMYLVFFYRGKAAVPLSPKLDYSFKMIKEIIVIGLPAAMRNLTNATGVFFTTKFVVAYGASVIAAQGIVFRLESFGTLPVVAMGTATITMVGQNFGADQIKRAKQSGWVSAGIGVLIMAIFGLVMFIFAPWAVSIFSNDPQVVDYGTQLLRIKAPAFMFSALIIILSSAFNSFGKAHYSLFVTVARVVVMIALAYWFDKMWGYIGVWWAIALTSIGLGCVVTLWYYLWRPPYVEKNSVGK